MKFELKIPPLLQLLIVGIFMYICSIYFETLKYESNISLYILLAPGLLGSIILIWSVISFWIHKTTVNPFTPEKSTSLVINGVYSFTRNPMYLGFVLISLSFALLLQNFLSIVLSFVYLLYLNKYQIKPEEKTLVIIFGKEYKRYMENVRRWI